MWTRRVELDPRRKLELSLIEDPTVDVGGDEAWCAWCLWPAAKVMVAYLSTLEDAELAGCSVLELGAGCGAVGMYLAQRGCSPVVLTDVYKALPLLRRNVQANGLSCEVLPLPWGTPLPRLAPDIRRRVPFQLVVASDCTYDFVGPETPSPSLEALLTSAALGARALVCVSRRRNEVEAFEATLARLGLSPEVVHRGLLEDAAKEGVSECLVYSFVFPPAPPAAAAAAAAGGGGGDAPGRGSAAEEQAPA